MSDSQVPDRVHLPATRTDVVRVASGNAPLDPQVRAQARRDRGDQAQIAWDVSTNPANMLQALFDDEPDPAILLPPARFIEYATKRFGERGKRVDPVIWNQTMRTSAKMVLRGDFNSATVWMRHAYTGAGLALTPDEAYSEMCGMVRHFFPCAPRAWLRQEWGRVDERKVLETKRSCNCGVSTGIRANHEAECAATYLRRTDVERRRPRGLPGP